MIEMGYCTVGGRVHSFPRYYLEKLGLDMIEYRNDAKNLERLRRMKRRRA